MVPEKRIVKSAEAHHSANTANAKIDAEIAVALRYANTGLINTVANHVAGQLSVFMGESISVALFAMFRVLIKSVNVVPLREDFLFS